MSTRLPAIAPMMISSNATDTAIQACIAEAISASPIHSADANQILSIPNPLFVGRGRVLTNRPEGKMKPAGRRVTKEIPPCDGKWQESSALAGGSGELHPLTLR